MKIIATCSACKRIKNEKFYSNTRCGTCYKKQLTPEAGLSWYEVADKALFYIDFGMSNGMKNALERAVSLGYKPEKIELRNLSVEQVCKLKKKYPD